MKRIALPLLLLAGCGPKPKPVAVTGTLVHSGGAEIVGGHAWFPDGKRGVFYGTIQRAGGKPAYGYVIRVLTPAAEFRNYRGVSSQVGDVTYAINSISFGAGTVHVEHGVRPDGAEVLKINGRGFDPSLGRVFVLDLRSGHLEQRDFPLPADGPPILGLKAVADRGDELLNLLW